jgi:hypothetical protein
MKGSKIFLVADDADSLTQMTETTYITEGVLQSFLARYPDLLPGDQINPDNPRRWLLVTREMGVPGAETETGRWSLDHLFLDQDGIPTFVECKRSTDTRARREVVAQMLDYAANGVEYWKIGSLRQAALETHGDALDDKIADLIGLSGEEAVDQYWKDVERNLHTRVIRLIFVADDLPKELRRLIEFLNEQMTDVEVLGVEIKQYAQSDSKQTALVPHVIGATETARALKQAGSTPRQKTSAEDFLASCGAATAPIFQYVWDKAQARGHTIYWGAKGFSVRVQRPDRLATFVYGYPSDAKGGPVERLEFYFKDLALPDEVAAPLRQDLLAQGVFVEAGQQTLRAYLQGETLHKITAVYDFILDRVDEIVAQHSAA